MADDPNRDILPVREVSCVDTCRSSIDPRERHVVCKLDRYQLEDRYLRLLEEAHDLKKLTNRQEDKIKRLATKLMRVSANPRPCLVTLDVHEDKNKIIALEIENSKLKDKISVLRNQLLSHTISGRSSSRNRNLQTRPSSGRITCRSENSRTKIRSCHCIVGPGNNDSDEKNNLDKIGELEAQKAEMSSRIAELEKQLLDCTVAKEREKVVENVEYIKVWRQMKQLNDKLIASERENESLNVQINDLKKTLEEKMKINEEITTELQTEKKRAVEIDELMLKEKDSQHSLREKDEQIKDLMNEMKILQQHNNELIGLSSKYGEVELENKELKKKVNEQLCKQENLKTAFNTEQTTIVALQNSNEQLLGKLQELQMNIDILTVQLTTFQTQMDRQEKSQATQITSKQNEIKSPAKVKQYKDCASQVEKCNKCCEPIGTILQVDIASTLSECKRCCEKTMPLEETTYTSRKSVKLTDRSVQTDNECKEKRDQGTLSMTPVKEKPGTEKPKAATQSAEPAKPVTESSLTPEKMLKLLEEAQINTSLDAARFSQKHMAGGVTLDQNQGHRQVVSLEKLLFGDSNSSGIEKFAQTTQWIQNVHQQQVPDKQSTDPNVLVSKLVNILQEYSSSSAASTEANSLYRPTPSNKDQLTKDVNNNTITSSVVRAGCNARKYCSSPYNKPQPEEFKRKLWPAKQSPSRATNANDCTCNNLIKCNANSDCVGRCCNSVELAACVNPMNTEMHCGVRSIANIGKMQISRQLQDEAGPGPFKSWERRVSASQKGDDLPSNDPTLHDYVKQLNKCREIVSGVTGIPANEVTREEIKPETRKIGSLCSLDCPSNCVDVTSPVSDSFPLVIADGQGLLEFHIVSLQLSTPAKHILFQEKDISKVSLFVSWDIWGQETAFTPILKCPKLNFNSSFVYRVSDLSSFFSYVLEEVVAFQVNVFHESNDNYVVARGKLCIKDILDYPQNKLHYIAPMNSVIPCSIGMNFGQLSLWVRLSCDVEKVEAFKRRRGMYTQVPDESTPRRVSSPKPDIASNDDLMVLKDQDAADYVHYDSSPMLESMSPKLVATDPSSDKLGERRITRRRSIIGKDSLVAVKERDEEEMRVRADSTEVETFRGRKSVFGPEMQWFDSTDDAMDDNYAPVSKISLKGTLDEEKEVKQPEIGRLSLMEFNALVMSDIHTRRPMTTLPIINLHQIVYESIILQILVLTEGLGGGKEMRYDKSPMSSTEKNSITIEIINMILYPKSFVMQNPEYQLFYIEYCFLGYCGTDMETVSMRKPQSPQHSLTFNFKKTFLIGKEKHSLENSTLRLMLDDEVDPNIKFTVVCEPLPEETDTKECEEVGYAHLNIREYMLEDNEKVVSLPIFSMNEDEQIGFLKVCVVGLDRVHRDLGKSVT
ncbi:uncharacterized protein LOC143430136 [Xylocopa sonorina]|uniref:uncharacterized protein LOC143430136 n=1 Tax=Xylocopa sonorina TaxID=1818115 RepID=UPI00403AB05A